jgi:hypothetical protein
MSEYVDGVGVPQKHSTANVVLIGVTASIVGVGLLLGGAIVAWFCISQFSGPSISEMEIEAGKRAMAMNIVKEHIGTFELNTVKYDRKQSDHEIFWQKRTMLAFKVTGSLGEGFLVFEQDSYDGLGVFSGLVIGKTRYS